jgi:hypothetical protein
MGMARQEAQPARGVDHGKGAHRAPELVRTGDVERHAPGVEGHVHHPVLLVHLGPLLRGVPEQQVVEPLARHLPGLRVGDLGRGREVGVALHAAVARAEAGAPLAGEPRGHHLAAAPELLEEFVAGGEQRLADVEARKAVALEDRHPPPPAGEHRRGAGARGAAADDGDVVVVGRVGQSRETPRVRSRIGWSISRRGLPPATGFLLL